METLRIEGFRSIRDSGEINLKPLTVVIGKNSCGKSSFIRFFPLLKQSIEKEISETLLWYGDYVDFGDYESIKPKFSNEIPTSFEMKLKLSEAALPYFYLTSIFAEDFEMDVIIKIYVSEKHINKLIILFFDQTIEILMNENETVDKIMVNNICIEDFNYFWSRESRAVLPIIGRKVENNSYYFLRDDETIKNLIANTIREIVHKNTKEQKIRDLVEKIAVIQPKAKLRSFLCNYDNLSSVSNFFMSDPRNEDFLDKINAYAILCRFPALIFLINRLLVNEIDNIHYLKPIRANVNRYYRIQGLNIEHVDADGSNLAMVLYNLTDDERKTFEGWCENNFGIKFSVSKKSGHASLIVYDSQENEINLADTGYGYSQILPIIVELWLLINKNKDVDEKRITIVIEQPELHLHPAFQSKVIDLFANIISQAHEHNVDIKIIFETHSETMINRLGYLVSKGSLDKRNVNILAFAKKDAETIISPMEFNEMGRIRNWPIGFFSMED